MRRRVAWAAVGLALIAGPAAAGDAACLWNAFPEAERAKIASEVRAASGDPRQGMMQVMLALTAAPPQAWVAARQACGAAPENAEAVEIALTGYLMQLEAARRLEAEHGAAPGALEKAWAETDKALLAAPAAERTPEAQQAFVRGVLTRAGVKDPEDEGARLAFVGYLSGWMARTRGEAEF